MLSQELEKLKLQLEGDSTIKLNEDSLLDELRKLEKLKPRRGFSLTRSVCETCGRPFIKDESVQKNNKTDVENEILYNISLPDEVCHACGRPFMKDESVQNNNKTDEENKLLPNSGVRFIVKENLDEEFEFDIQINPQFSKGEISEEQKKLYNEAESTKNIIKSLINTKKAIKEKYFKRLLSLSQAGLVSDMANPQLALASLDKLKEEILSIEGQRIKNYYMKNLGIIACYISSIVIPLYLVVSVINPAYNMYFVVFISSLIGTWVSFGARKFNISFNQLNNLEEDMLIPHIRLIYIGLCSVIFLLFLNSGIIMINIGNLSIKEQIGTNFALQSTIGILCGLVESKLGVNIYNKAKTVVGEDTKSKEVTK